MRKFIAFILLFISGLLCFFLDFSFLIKEDKIQVSGIILNKYIEDHYRKNEFYRPRYIMNISPINKNKYREFNTEVSFSTYRSFNPGDKITLSNLNPSECLGDYNYKDHIWKGILACFIFIIGIILITSSIMIQLDI